jgi:hypothetical protein
MAKAPMDTFQLSCFRVAIALLLFTQAKSTMEKRSAHPNDTGQVYQTLPTSFHHGRVMTAADGKAYIAATGLAMLSGSNSKALIAKAVLGV